MNAVGDEEAPGGDFLVFAAPSDAWPQSFLCRLRNAVDQLHYGTSVDMEKLQEVRFPILEAFLGTAHQQNLDLASLRMLDVICAMYHHWTWRSSRRSTQHVLLQVQQCIC